jgi:hypothetical protein
MVGTCVVYLVWTPLGLDPLERFVASYRAHPSGCDHRLVLVLKGDGGGDVASRCRALASELGAECLQTPANGLDLDTYFAVAHRLRPGALCFLNSSSTILADSWLALLQRALQPPSVGLVGASGSFESALSAAPRVLRPLLRRRYPPFPNPHLRTNAFMLQRELMLSLDWPTTPRKSRALELESGNRSITRQLENRGLEVLVVGRDGRRFGPDQWRWSDTFRAGTQENLLIADNRTRQYIDADPGRRAALARYAWGDPGSAMPGTSAPRADVLT